MRKSSNLDKTKYLLLEPIQGSGLKLTEIRVHRVDWDPISEEEVEEVISEFRRLFPVDIYRLLHETKPAEDNTVLHIYVNLQKEERFQRGGSPGERVIVPKVEVEELLEKW